MPEDSIKKSDLNLLLESYKNAVETNLTNMEKQDQVIRLLLDSIETSKKLVDSIFLILKTLEQNNLKCSGERKVLFSDLSKVCYDLHHIIDSKHLELITFIDGNCNLVINAAKEKIELIDDSLSEKLNDTKEAISGINLNLANKGSVYTVIGALITAIIALIGLIVTLYKN